MKCIQSDSGNGSDWSYSMLLLQRSFVISVNRDTFQFMALFVVVTTLWTVRSACGLVCVCQSVPKLLLMSLLFINYSWKHSQENVSRCACIIIITNRSQRLNDKEHQPHVNVWAWIENGVKDKRRKIYVKKRKKMNEQMKERKRKNRGGKKKNEATPISCQYDKQCILVYRQSGKDLSSNFNRKTSFNAWRNHYLTICFAAI